MSAESSLVAVRGLTRLGEDLTPLAIVLAWSGAIVVGLNRLTEWRKRHGDKGHPGQTSGLNAVLDWALVGQPLSDAERAAIKEETEKAKLANKATSGWVSILIAFVGLQVSFLTWGWVQERIMTTTYGNGDKCPSTNMLVLSNRVFAILFAYIVIQYSYAGKNNMNRAPFVSFGLPSIANTVSSFAAYESLRFMSFPMSTVCKTLKIIPTMLVGTLVHRRVYTKHEYGSALVITLGAALFAAEFGAGGLEGLLENAGSVDGLAVLPGLILMAVYLGVDAFTSNLQTLLFQDYLLTPYECMLGINLFSVVLTLFNLVNAGEIGASLNFLARNPVALFDVSILALSSAVGQLFIYYTIERHGPIVFTVIQLIRQLLAILLSSWSFGHVVNFRAWIGLLMLFSGIFFLNSATAKAKASTPRAAEAKKQE